MCSFRIQNQLCGKKLQKSEKTAFFRTRSCKKYAISGPVDKKIFVVIIQPLSSLLVKNFRPEDFPVLNWEFFSELFQAKTLPPEN